MVRGEAITVRQKKKENGEGEWIAPELNYKS